MNESVCTICGKTAGRHYGAYRFCDSPSATGRTFTPSWYPVEIEKSETPLRIPRAIPVGTVLVSEDFVDAVRELVKYVDWQIKACGHSHISNTVKQYTELHTMLNDMEKEKE